MIGENIKEIRIKRGITQAQLADKLGLSEKTMSSWEVNRTEPSLQNLKDIAKVLNCTSAALLGEDYSISDDEYVMIKQIRMLDKYGMKAVKTTLRNELERCSAQNSH